LGDKSNDVKRLQELLKNDLIIYPEGITTGYYGSLTVAAVKRFQEKYGISAIGRVGPQTRAKLAEVFGGEKPMQVVPPAAVVEAPPAEKFVPVPVALGALNLTSGIGIGSSGSDVKALQEYLAQDTLLYPEG
jgi:peptidoglycan hydrolase-like protein with peptidoglycan-binding domain